LFLEALKKISEIINPLLTLGSSFGVAWYVNRRLKKIIEEEQLNEKRLRDLYRPMDITLRASKMAFQRYIRASDEEQKFIAKLWYQYNMKMKNLIMKNSYLFIESEVPDEVDKIIEHIDAFLFDYNEYVNGKKENPFPGERGYPFPEEILDYFYSRSKKLANLLGAE